MAIFQFLLDVSLKNTIAVTRLEKLVNSSTKTARIRMEIASALLEKARNGMKSKTDHSAIQAIYQRHISNFDKNRKYCALCRRKPYQNSMLTSTERTFVRCSDFDVYWPLNNRRNCYPEYYQSSLNEEKNVTLLSAHIADFT